MISPLERKVLRQLIKIAAAHAHETRPNPPAVAAVISNDTEIIIGRHHGPGTPHAEVEALAAAGPKAKGATLIVTLEPCTHWGANPPCTDAIIASGIRRVIFPITDPNPLVSAHPATAQLTNAGIAVESGFLQRDATIANAEFLTHVSLNRPYIVAKVAASLDGKTALATGESKYISGKAALQFVHKLRSHCDAIMVGIGTVIADDPQLNIRLEAATHRPYRKIILDTHARIPQSSRLFENTSKADIIIVVAETAPPNRVSELSKMATILKIPGPTLRHQWGLILHQLHHLGIYRLLLEGGTTVLSDAIDSGMVDQLMVIHSPILIGGNSPFSVYSGLGTTQLSNAPALSHVTYHRAGRDMITNGYLNDPLTLLRSTTHS